jgi:hypothetical protein
MAGDQESCSLQGVESVSNLKPIIRRLEAAEDVEGYAMYLAEGSTDAAFRFLERDQ